MNFFGKYTRLFFLLLIAYCLLPFNSFSQSPAVETSIDKKDILIGEQVLLKIKTVFPPHSSVINYVLSVPDTIPHFAIIEKSRIDTIVYKDKSSAMLQTVLFTSFDSGVWVIPSFEVQFSSNDIPSVQKLMTDSFTVNVSYSPADSTGQLRDIKPIRQVKITDYTWLYIVGSFLVLLVIGLGIWYYLRKRKHKPELLVQSALSPFEEAMQELEKLNGYDMVKHDEVKLYHTRLSDIFKRYFGRKQNLNLANSTTGDLLIQLSVQNHLPETISNLATALRCNDAVKFAKFIPLPFESNDCRLKITAIIKLVEQQNINPKS